MNTPPHRPPGSAASARLAARARRGMRTTLWGLLLSTFLGLVKIAAGVLGHAYALIADGVESLLDILASLVVLGGMRIGARPPDANHPWGHGKAESMAALVVAVCLLAAAATIAVESVREILTPHHAPEPYTLVVLLGAVAVKELWYRHMRRVGQEVRSTSLVADAWHHRSDALTSAAAFAGISVALIGGEGFEPADDWAALFACAVIAFNGVRVLRVAVDEIMDVAAPPQIEAAIRQRACRVPGVRDVDKCLVRKSGQGWLVSIHVMVDGNLSVAEGHRIAHEVKDALLASDLHVLDALVHVEPHPVETALSSHAAKRSEGEGGA